MSAERFSIPIPVAGLAGALFVLHVVGKWLNPTHVFLVPGTTMVIPFQLITCGLFDDSLPNLLLGVPVLVYTGSILHARWGAVELARFLAVANVLMACLSWLSMIVLYVLFRDEHFLFARLGGVSGALGALAVALRQQALRAPPPPAGAAPSPAALLAPHAPALQLAASAALLVVAHAGPPDELLFAVHGLFVGWLYLRYYQPQPSGAWGDASDAFAFAALFPPAVQPPLRALGRVTFGVASACGCCPLSGWAPPIDEGAGAALLNDVELGLLGSAPAPAPPAVTTHDPEVAERRRQRARALLEERLKMKAEEPPPTSPPPKSVGIAQVFIDLSPTSHSAPTRSPDAPRARAQPVRAQRRPAPFPVPTPPFYGSSLSLDGA